MNVDEVVQLQKELSGAEQKKENIKGKIEEIVSTMEREFKCDSIEKLRTKHTGLLKKLVCMEKELESQLHELSEIVE